MLGQAGGQEGGRGPWIERQLPRSRGQVQDALAEPGVPVIEKGPEGLQESHMRPGPLGQRRRGEGVGRGSGEGPLEVEKPGRRLAWELRDSPQAPPCTLLLEDRPRLRRMRGERLRGSMKSRFRFRTPARGFRRHPSGYQA